MFSPRPCGLAAWHDAGPAGHLGIFDPKRYEWNVLGKKRRRIFSYLYCPARWYKSCCSRWWRCFREQVASVLPPDEQPSSPDASDPRVVVWIANVFQPKRFCVRLAGAGREQNARTHQLGRRLRTGARDCGQRWFLDRAGTVDSAVLALKIRHERKLHKDGGYAVLFLFLGTRPYLS